VASGATESAAAGTVLGTGVKITTGTLGFAPAGTRLLTVGEQAMEVRKKVGLVTSVPFNHATPAGFIAHNKTRNDYHGVATEMIASGVDVLIGGGPPNYTDANTSRASHFGAGSWISQPDFECVTKGQISFSYIKSKADFERVADGENVPDKLFGLARVAETFQYSRPGVANKTVLPFTDAVNADVPSLATSTRAALNVLEKDEEGFFLMLESSAVAWAGHANQTTRVVEERLSFNDSVDAVTDWVEKKLEFGRDAGHGDLRPRDRLPRWPRCGRREGLDRPDGCRRPAAETCRGTRVVTLTCSSRCTPRSPSWPARDSGADRSNGRCGGGALWTRT
jgi:alkaline phosphatase